MKKHLVSTVAAAAVLGMSAGAANADDLTPIGISYQPALYWAVPFYIATEEGWWAEVGLDPSFTTFASGAPQVAAAEAGDWVVGGTGSAPAVLGAARFNIVTIGITNDESAGNVVMARGDQADEILDDPSILIGESLLLTTNSTGEFAALSCLEHLGLEADDMQVVNLDQAEIISAFSAGEGMLAGVWAPNNYTLMDRIGAETICDGQDAGAVVPGTLVTTEEFASENPELVARFLAVYLRSIAWQRDNPEQTIEYMRAFYDQGGVLLPDEFLEMEVELRPTFTLDEQLEILDRSDGDAMVDDWYSELGAYLEGTGTVDQAPDTHDFIDPTFMQMVHDDEELRAFANNE